MLPPPPQLLPVYLFGGSLAVAVAYLFLTTTPGKKKFTTSIPGLENNGQVCYVNALLQGLASLPSFLEWLKKEEIFEQMSKRTFFNDLREVFVYLTDPEISSTSAGALINSMQVLTNTMDMAGQQDVHELFNFILHLFNDEMTRNSEHSLYEGIGVFDPATDEVERLVRKPTSTEMLFVGHENDDTSHKLKDPLSPPCYGIMHLKLQCIGRNCSFKKQTQEEFSAICVSGARYFDGKLVTVEAMLRKYFAPEFRNGAACNMCKQPNGLIASQGITLFPDALLIRIERIVYEYGSLCKWDKHVAFGATLRTEDFQPDHVRKGSATSAAVSTSSEPSEKVSSPQPFKKAAGKLYQLTAVTEHRGTPNFGHYVTYRKHKDQWFYANDKQVQRVSFADVQRAEAYMLYYELVR
ncbi:unnamed protein product, partial [Mesorhabditis spiculigera]